MKFSNLPDRRLFRYNYNLCWKINGEKAWEFNNNKEIYIHKDQEIQKVININYRRIAFEDELLEGQEVKELLLGVIID